MYSFGFSYLRCKSCNCSKYCWNNWAVELIGIGPVLGNIGAIPYSKSVTFVLGLLPIFILIGFLAYQAGITRQLFEAAKAWVGFVPGGLAVATVFATAGFAAVSGLLPQQLFFQE